MRIAVVSDIHANLTALDAVIADIRRIGADLVIHGGDLVGGGPRPAEVIDRIREMKWPGVYGNTDEMLWSPKLVTETLAAPPLHRIRDLLLAHTIPATIAAVGDERLHWLKMLPGRWAHQRVGVVHAVPNDAWANVRVGASDEDLERTFVVLGTSVVVFGHIHQPFVRRLPGLTIANSGAVSQSFDGDPRAAYALVDDDSIEIRRVEYDIEQEVELLLLSEDPFGESTIETLRTGRYAPLRSPNPEKAV